MEKKDFYKKVEEAMVGVEIPEKLMKLIMDGSAFFTYEKRFKILKEIIKIKENND